MNISQYGKHVSCRYKHLESTRVHWVDCESSCVIARLIVVYIHYLVINPYIGRQESCSLTDDNIASTSNA